MCTGAWIGSGNLVSAHWQEVWYGTSVVGRNARKKTHLANPCLLVIKVVLDLRLNKIEDDCKQLSFRPRSVPIPIQMTCKGRAYEFKKRWNNGNFYHSEWAFPFVDVLNTFVKIRQCGNYAITTTNQRKQLRIRCQLKVMCMGTLDTTKWIRVLICNTHTCNFH